MQIKFNLIVAVSENMGIGKNGNLPWKLKNEMAHFTRLTSTTTDAKKRNIVIMGRKTWDSIPPKFKPLKNRINFVLSSSNLNLKEYEDSYVFKSFEEVCDKLEDVSFIYENVWIIGGSSLYKESLNLPNFHKLYLTKIHKTYECDTFLPKLPENLKETVDETIPKEIQEENGIKYSYHVYIKELVAQN